MLGRRAPPEQKDRVYSNQVLIVDLTLSSFCRKAKQKTSEHAPGIFVLNGRVGNMGPGKGVMAVLIPEASVFLLSSSGQPGRMPAGITFRRRLVSQVCEDKNSARDYFNFFKKVYIFNKKVADEFKRRLPEG